METMQFHIIKMNFNFRTIFLAFKWSYLTLWHAQEISLVSVQCRSIINPKYPGALVIPIVFCLNF